MTVFVDRVLLGAGDSVARLWGWNRGCVYIDEGVEDICSYIWRIFKAIITCQICAGPPARRAFIKKIDMFIYQLSSVIKIDDVTGIIAQCRTPYKPTQATDQVVQDTLGPFITLPPTAINVCIMTERIDFLVLGSPPRPYSFQLFLSYNIPALPRYEHYSLCFPLEIRED